MVEAVSNISEFPKKLSDLEVAAGYRQRLQPLLQQACDVLNEARREGLEVAFQVGQNQLGQQQVVNIVIYRPL